MYKRYFNQPYQPTSGSNTTSCKYHDWSTVQPRLFHCFYIVAGEWSL